MVSICISVKKSIALSSKTGILTTGMTGVTVLFDFDNEWKDLTKHIEFKVGDDSFSDVLPDDNLYTVPPEMLIREDEVLYIGVRGVNASEEIIIPTVYAMVGNIEKGSVSGFPESQTWFQKLVDTIKGIVTSIADTAKRIFAMEVEMDQIQDDLDQIKNELDNIETADEIYIGEDEPSDPNVCLWITRDDEMSEGDPETGGSVVDPETIKQAVDNYMAEHPMNVQETDPTVPAWAKQPNKPTYTAAEVGAMPADAEIPMLPAFPETAEVGQTIVVKAVDENGKPTEWEAADFPAGGDSAGWKLVANVTVEEDVDRLTIETDTDGKSLLELGYSELFVRYKLLGLGSGNYSSRYSNLQMHFCGGFPGGRDASFTNLGNGYDTIEASVYAVYPKPIDDTNVATTGVAIHNNGLVKPFGVNKGVLGSANITTGAGIKAGSQVVVYGR